MQRCLAISKDMKMLQVWLSPSGQETYNNTVASQHGRIGIRLDPKTKHYFFLLSLSFAAMVRHEASSPPAS